VSAAVPAAGRVAVMQPYLYPYAGYFRLMAACGTFIIFDDVQFPRRGRVHRCEMPHPHGGTQWLTLPLARHPRDALINTLSFAADARATLDRRLARYPWLAPDDSPASGRTPLSRRVAAHLHGPLGSVADFLEAGLRIVADELQLPARILRSSSFGLDPALRGQERIIALVRATGADTYVNAPGGRALYNAGTFRQAGLDLAFLPPYQGAYRHLLPALMTAEPTALRADILATALPDPQLA
jgi:hypothetical protein